MLKSIETGDTEPVAVVNEAKYTQRNPQTHEGGEGLATLFDRLFKTESKVNMVRGFEDGDFVFTHMKYDFSNRKKCFRVFRFEDGQAVEHWDTTENIAPRQEWKNNNGKLRMSVFRATLGMTSAIPLSALSPFVVSKQFALFSIQR